MNYLTLQDGRDTNYRSSSLPLQKKNRTTPFPRELGRTITGTTASTAQPGKRSEHQKTNQPVNSPHDTKHKKSRVSSKKKAARRIQGRELRQKHFSAEEEEKKREIVDTLPGWCYPVRMMSFLVSDQGGVVEDVSLFRIVTVFF